jgi:hypothetical protein
MGHDATKVKMGSTGSSFKQGSETFPSDPEVFSAGLAVRRTSGSLLSVTKTDGEWIGISLGKSLANEKHTTVLNAGTDIPVQLESTPASGSATITSYANLVSGTPDSITIGATVFTAQAGAATPGAGTFQAATSNNATAASLVAQINAHATAGALVKAVANGAIVEITAKGNTSAGNSIALIYTDNDTNVGATVSGATLTGGGTAANYVVKGQKVYFSDTTGKADDPDSEATISDAVYVSGVLTGLSEAGTEISVALIDAPGGL